MHEEEQTTTVLGYSATRAEGRLTVHRVPIFCACERGSYSFDEAWVSKAVRHAMRQQEEGYMPPLHIRHHEPSTDMNNAVQAVGFFRILGAEPITLQGKRRNAIVADLIFTDATAMDAVLSMRLPYRSVEIHDVDKPSIDSLALLDHEAPFLELPMLKVSDITDEGDAVAGATFGASWSMDATAQGSPVVACFRKGAAASLLFHSQERPAMAIKNNTIKKAEAFGKGIRFEADEPEENDENMEGEGGGGLDVAAVCKAIESGEISVADMDALLAAIQAQQGAGDEVEEEEAPAPAATPGAEAMSKGTPEVIAALQGKVIALEAQGQARDAEVSRKESVALAMKRLEGRPLGSDLESKLHAYHLEHGGPAFDAHVEAMVQTFGALPATNDKGELFLSQSKGAPAVALKYQEHGADAVEKAAHFASEWAELNAHGIARNKEETYVQNNMKRVHNLSAN